MKFIIEKNNKYTLDFVIWLLPKIQKHLINSIRIAKLVPIADYIDKNILPMTPLRLKSLLFREILSLHVIETKFAYIIQPSYKFKYRGYKVDYFSRIVNYGNEDIRGISLFTRGYNLMYQNLQKFYNAYCLLGPMWR